MPATRHYSWDKGANILGLGRDNLVKVPVDQDSRMDVEKLKNELEICLKKVNLHSHDTVAKASSLKDIPREVVILSH